MAETVIEMDIFPEKDIEEVIEVFQEVDTEVVTEGIPDMLTEVDTEVVVKVLKGYGVWTNKNIGSESKE